MLVNLSFFSKKKILVSANHKALSTFPGSINDCTSQGGDIGILFNSSFSMSISSVVSLLNSFFPLLHILRIIICQATRKPLTCILLH